MRNRTCKLIIFTFYCSSPVWICWNLDHISTTKLQNLTKTSSRLTLEKVSKRRYVFLVIAPNVGRHAFLDRWRNAQKDGQGDQVRDRGEHSFAKLKVTYNQFLAWLKRTKKEQIVQWKRNGDL